MALEGLNLVNSTVVYDTRNSMNTYNRALQTQQLKLQKEQKELADELGSVKSDGIREADKPEFQRLFQNWQDKSIEASNERDPQKKMLKQSEAKIGRLNLEQLGGDSKRQGAVELDIDKQMFDPKVRGRYKDGTLGEMRNNKKLSIRDPKYISDYSSFEIITDTSQVSKMLQDIDDDLYKNRGVLKNGKSTSQMQGRDRIWTTTTYRNINPEEQVLAYKTAFVNKPEIKAAAIKEFPDEYEALSTDEFYDFAARQLVANRKSSKEEEISTNKESHAPKGSGDGSKEKEQTYRQQLIKGIIDNDPKSLDRLKAYLPTGSKIEYRTSNKTKDSKGGYNLLRVFIPSYTDENNKRYGGMTEDISFSKGDAFNRLNYIISQYSGQNVTMDKINIEQGKPTGKIIEVKGKAKASDSKPSGNSFKSKSGIKFTVEQNG